jgi:cytoskeletal protein CcmA (bactofilin family)
MIQGQISGEINSKALVVIGEKGSVEGNIKASNVQIQGFLKGEVTASKTVEVTAKGKVVGNITAAEIFMEPGCTFDGRCFMK